MKRLFRLERKLVLTLFAAASMIRCGEAKAEGIDDMVDALNTAMGEASSALEVTVSKDENGNYTEDYGHGRDYGAAQDHVRTVVLTLERNYRALPVSIEQARRDNPAYVPKKLDPIPRNLRPDYYDKHIRALSKNYAVILDKIDTMRIERGINQFRLLVNIFNAAYKTAKSATDLLEPSVLGVIDLPKTLQEIDASASEISSAASDVRISNIHIQKARRVKSYFVAYSRSLRRSYDHMREFVPELERMKELRDAANLAIERGIALPLVEERAVPQFDNTDFLNALIDIHNGLLDGTMPWDSAGPLADQTHDKAEASYEASNKDAGSRADWGEFEEEYDALRDLFAERTAVIAELLAKGAEWEAALEDLLGVYDTTDLGEDLAGLRDCSPRNAFASGQRLDYTGGHQWPGFRVWREEYDGLMARAGGPPKLSRRTASYRSCEWLEYIVDYPVRVQELLDDYGLAWQSAFSSMDQHAQQDADNAWAYQVAVYKKSSLKDLVHNLRAIKDDLETFEQRFAALSAGLRADVSAKSAALQAKANAYFAFIESEPVFLSEAEFGDRFASADGSVQIHATGDFLALLELEMESLEAYPGIVSDSVDSAWEQADGIERNIDATLDFNRKLDGQTHLAEQMQRFQDTYVGYGDPSILHYALSMLDNNIFMVFFSGEAGFPEPDLEATVLPYWRYIRTVGTGDLQTFTGLASRIWRWTGEVGYIAWVGMGYPQYHPSATDDYYKLGSSITGERHKAHLILNEHRDAMDALNEARWPAFRNYCQAEEYGYVSLDQIRRGLPVVRSWLAAVEGVPAPASQAARIELIGPGPYTVPAGGSANKPLCVRVLDGQGGPAGSERVEIEYAGSYAKQFAMTDATGRACFRPDLRGASVGTLDATVRVPGSSVRTSIPIHVRNDSDGDGCDDRWETSFGFSARLANSDDDYDGDSLTNQEEYRRGTNPLLADSDGDGDSDGIEAANGTDPFDPTENEETVFDAPPAPRPTKLGTDWRRLATDPAGLADHGVILGEPEARVQGLISFQGELLMFVYYPERVDFDTVVWRNQVWTSADGEVWVLKDDAPDWQGTYHLYALFVHNQKLFVAPGAGDLWETENGTDWTRVNGDLPEPRMSLVFRSYAGRIWLFGGTQYDDGTRTLVDGNGLWSSPDGVDWTQHTDNLPFPERSLGTASIGVADDKLWMIGGKNDDYTGVHDHEFKDVWSMEMVDGEPVWTEVLGSTGWPGRTDAGFLTVGNMIWVFGGFWWANPNQFDSGYKFQIWGSVNGANWTMLTEAPPSLPDGLSHAPAVHNGGVYSHVRSTDGGADVWGSLPSGNEAEHDYHRVEKKSATVSAGESHVLAIAPNGTLWAWGDNRYGQFGNGTTQYGGIDTSEPVLIGADTDWAAVQAGAGFSLALKTDGTLWSWGRNNYGQLGDGTTDDRGTPAQVGADADWTQIAAGGTHCLALKTDGSLYAWGRNDEGQLGDGTTADSHTPVRVGDDTDWIDIDCGASHSMGVKADDSAWGWGKSGARGFDYTLTDNVPSQGQVFAGAGYDSWENLRDGVGQIYAGGNNCVAVRRNGGLHAFGLDAGVAPVPHNRKPALADEQAWVAAACGYRAAAAINSRNELWVWGGNGTTGIGVSDVPDTTPPVQLGGDQDWVAVEVGGRSYSDDGFFLARKADGSLWAWGQNSLGQLGIGTTDTARKLVRVLPFDKPAADTDGDWIDDAWERRIFGDLSRDGAGDYDLDGLSDFSEWRLGLKADHGDSDGDGISDGREVSFGLDPHFDDSNNMSSDEGLTNLEQATFSLATLPVGHTNSVAAYGDFVYYLGGGGVHVVDVSVPAEAQERAPVGLNLANPWELRVVGDFLYVEDDGAIVKCSLETPQTPQRVGSFEAEGFVQGWEVVGDWLYLSDGEGWPPVFRVVNIADINAPVVHGVVDAADFSPGPVFDSGGDRVVVADGGSGLRILDVSDPDAPAEVGRYDAQLVWPPAVAARDGLLFVGVSPSWNSDEQFSIRTLDISDPAAIDELDRYDGYPSALLVTGDLIFIAQDPLHAVSWDPVLGFVKEQEYSGQKGFMSDMAANDTLLFTAQQGMLEITALARFRQPPPDAPKAIVDASRDRVAPGETVRFDAGNSFHRLGTREIVRYEWDFDYEGDGFDVDAVGRVVRHTFGEFGQFKVALRVICAGDVRSETSDIALDLVDVTDDNLAPSAAIGGPYAAYVGTGLTLDAGASFEPNSQTGDRIVLFEWDLDDDGQFDDAEGVRVDLGWHEIEALGLAFPANPVTGAPANPIRLRVTDTLGETDVDGTTVQFFEDAPLALFTYTPSLPEPGRRVFFDATSSMHPNPDRELDLFEWDFDYDGQTFDVDAVGARVDHAFERFGEIAVAVRVTDDAPVPQTDLRTQTLAVDGAGQAPVVVHGGPYLLLEGTGVRLDASASYDPDAAFGDTIESFAWDLNGDGLHDDADTPVVELTWDELAAFGLRRLADPGTLLPVNTVGVQVTDSLGVSVVEQIPILILPDSALIAAFGVSATSAAPTQELQFDASASTHGTPGRGIVKYEWDFDYEGGPFFAEAAGMTVDHSFPHFGDYNVALRVTDDAEPPQSMIATTWITVDQGNRAPVADAGGPYDIRLGGELVLDASGSSDPDLDFLDDLVAFDWDVDDDGEFDDAHGIGPTLGASVLDTLLLAGPADPDTGEPTNTVRLRVTDLFGRTHVAETRLTLYLDEPVARFVATPADPEVGERVHLDASTSFHGHPDRAITTYEWDFDYDGRAFVVDATGVAVDRRLDEQRRTLVALRVTDDNATPKTDVAVQVVLDPAPLLEVDIPHGWSLLSLPFDRPETSPATLLAGDDGLPVYSGSLWTYNARERIYSALADGFLAKEGFWTYGRLAGGATLRFRGTPTEHTAFQSTVGWNLHGPAETMDAPDGDWWGWDGETYFRIQDDHPQAPWHIAGKLIQGHGYWYFEK